MCFFYKFIKTITSTSILIAIFIILFYGMNKILFFIFFLISPVFSAQDMKSELQKIVEKHQLIGLSVFTFQDKNEQSYFLGLKNELQKLHITSETKFRIASISKSFTALGLMKLLDQKKIKLNDDVSGVLGFLLRNPNFPNRPITFKMILSHTSSIADGAGYDKFLAETYNKLPVLNISNVLVSNGSVYTNDMFLNKAPGTFFNYSNLNYGILGTLIEKLSSQRFDAYMRNEILLPLGIKSSFNVEDIADFENIATLYRSENGAWKPQKDDFLGTKPKLLIGSDYENGTNGAFFGPQGGLRCSSRDLITLLKFLKTNGKTIPNVISKSTIRKMKKVQWFFDGDNGDSNDGFFERYGLGLHITNTNSRDEMGNKSIFGDFIGHSGNAYGLISNAYFCEKKNLGFVIITNGSFTSFKNGTKTAFTQFEEEIFQLLMSDFQKNM
jgi:CubicO group peptidase (beta-lactamase class C family)